MKKGLLWSYLPLLAISILLICCKGKDGEIGPAGAKGDAGPKGTANVIYSEWLTIPQQPSIMTDNFRSYYITAKEITADMWNRGGTSWLCKAERF